MAESCVLAFTAVCVIVSSQSGYRSLPEITSAVAVTDQIVIFNATYSLTEVLLPLDFSMRIIRRELTWFRFSNVPLVSMDRSAYLLVLTGRFQTMDRS